MFCLLLSFGKLYSFSEKLVYFFQTIYLAKVVHKIYMLIFDSLRYVLMSLFHS